MDESFSITLAGASGDRWYNPSNARIGVSQYQIGNSTTGELDHQELQIGIANLENESETTITFQSPEASGEYLAVGYYGDAQRWNFADPGRPGISMTQIGFCSVEFGDFEIRDIRWDGPRITGIWITYRRFCGNAWESRPTFGEIRLGYPTAAYEVSPSVVRWPAGTYPGRASYDVPILVRPTADAAVEITDVAVTGPHADDFPIRDSGCSGVLDAAGCIVRVGFEPSSPGPRHASLQVLTSAGTTDVSLDAAGALGETEWQLDVDYEAPDRADENLVMTTSDSAGGPFSILSAAVDDDGLVWRASFSLWPGPGETEAFVEGREYSLNPDGTSLQLGFSHGNAGCEEDQATARINDLEFTGPDDKLALLDLDFEVHCRANYGHTARGRIRFHDRDDQTPPPAVTDGTAAPDGDRLNLQWTNPDVSDLAGVIVRSYPGDRAPGAPDAGELVYLGGGETASIATASEGTSALSIWTYDDSGNVGAPYELNIER